MKISFWLENKQFDLDIKEQCKNEIVVRMDEKEYRVSAEFLCRDEVLLNIDGNIFDVFITANSTAYSVGVNGKTFHIEKKSALQILGPDSRESKRADVKTSMPGKIVSILAGPEEEVKKGQPVLILEAMKMQNEIKSPRSGRIIQIFPEEGDSVKAGEHLFIVE